MNYSSCDNCGVVINLDCPALETKTIFNHDGDMKSTASKCPVCGDFVSHEDWVKNE